MSFLTNNGLFWLIFSLALALIILLIIYIIKPNYQQRFVSSTYVWQLSLRYRKKKIPVNRLRSIIILICQILILTACAFIIARPAIQLFDDYTVSEVAIIMDTSASMRTQNEEGISRIDRAATEALEFGKQVLEDGGIVSVIQCGNGAQILTERVTGEGAIPLLENTFADIVENGCTYASTNLNDALELCEDYILNRNGDAEIYIYTDENYTRTPDGVNVISVADEESEWNAAILGAYTEKIDGYYALFVEFTTYGMATTLSFDITFKNPQWQGDGIVTDEVDNAEYFRISDEVECDGEETVTYVMMFDETYDTTYSAIIGNMDNYVVSVSADYTIYYYEEIEVAFSDTVEDSYDLDNTYYVYGGQPQVIRVLYTTIGSEGNIFTPAALSEIQSAFAGEYDILITYEYATRDTIDTDGTSSGFDFYVYEHIAPTYIPEDGIVFLFDPDIAPRNAGFEIESYYENVSYECSLHATDEAESSPIMRNINADDINLTKATLLTNYSSVYTTLMDFDAAGGTYPALMMKDDGDSKVLVMPFSVNWSNIALQADFPILFYNIFAYFYPTVITGTDYVVGDTIEVNTNGESLELWRLYNEIWDNVENNLLVLEAVQGESYYYVSVGEGYEEEEVEMPISFVASKPGRYLIYDMSYFYDGEGQRMHNDYMIFVHADLSESDIFSYGISLNSPYKEKETSELYDDLLLWLAIAIVALVFIEWILHMFEGI